MWIKAAYVVIVLTLVFLTAAASAQPVKISGFANMDLGSWSGSGDLTDTNALCVYNANSSNYRIRARGAGPPANAFTLSGTGGEVSYEVRFETIQLTADTFQNFSNANTSSSTCSGGSNTTLEVRATAAQLSGALAGSYSGTLTVLLEPN